MLHKKKGQNYFWVRRAVALLPSRQFCCCFTILGVAAAGVQLALSFRLFGHTPNNAVGANMANMCAIKTKNTKRLAKKNHRNNKQHQTLITNKPI